MNRVCLTLTSVLLFAFAATAQTTNGLPDAEIQGQQLAQEILQQSPATNLTETESLTFSETGVLTVRNSEGMKTNLPIKFDTLVSTQSWTTFYSTGPTNYYGKNIYALPIRLVVVHRKSLPNIYIKEPEHIDLKPSQIMAPFAGSDFWIADLGLEFFHWPDQKVLRHEPRRTRNCTVLESTNPDPSPGSYSHVDSWVDDETLGIVHAEAYDASGKLLKVFDPKSFKKVNGQWQLQDMEIKNVQTKSRTWIKFDLDNKS